MIIYFHVKKYVYSESNSKYQRQISNQFYPIHSRLLWLLTAVFINHQFHELHRKVRQKSKDSTIKI